MMRTSPAKLSWFEPRTKNEALAMLASERGLTPFAGGTDLYVTLNAGTERARRFLDLSRISTLRRITRRGDRLVIGARATYTDLIRSAEVRAWIPSLVDAARQVGGVQIQNRGTIGGNLGNASPAGDTLPVLAVADAVIVLESSAGERRVAFADYYTGYKRSVRRSDELITAIEIPRLPGTPWFRKVGARAAQAISKVVAAGVASVEEPRFAIGAVGPTVIRSRAVEDALRRGDSEDAVRRALRSEIAPIDDVRSTREYRTRVAEYLVSEFARTVARKVRR